MPHRYSIRFALFLMTLDTGVHAGGGARGQNLGHLNFFFFFFFKNDILISFQSRTEDLTQRVCPRLGIQVSSVYRSKIDMSF